jgi:S-adenosylmethionine hydrolase
VSRVLTLLTDYGPASEHVGALHAVLARVCPEADRVDLAHDLPPGDVRWASIVLGRLAPLTPGAVHLAVVDPGVGTDRRAVALELADGGWAVGPDNGLLSALVPSARAAVVLPGHSGSSATFDGRDVFAPAAARLRCGTPLADLGSPVATRELRICAAPEPEVRPGRVATRVLGRDRFGNIALAGGDRDLAAASLASGDRVHVALPGAERAALVGRTFADVAPGALLLYVDSWGMASLAERDGDAWRAVAAAVDAAVVITALD